MTAPLVGIVGRPNVGKSTLFNRLVGGRPALVHDTPGLTRDRRYGTCDYFGTELRIVDTGGLDPDAATDVIGAGIHRQALRAIGEADALLLVVDGRAGISSVDHDLARQLRTTGKPVFLAVNKVDHAVRDDLVHDFHELGLGAPFPVSAAHGRGIDALLEAIVHAVAPPPPAADPLETLDEDDEPHFDPDQTQEDDDEDAPLRVAFVGRPNAGKSSLTNRLLGEERSLVHHVAGTTTDPVDTPFTLGGRAYILVDTAGIRRKAKIDIDIEKISVTMAIGQIDRADVVVLVIDGELGPAEQDARIAGMIEESGRALVIAMNKTDRVLGDEARERLRELTKDTFHFLPWAPIVQVSALRGDGVDHLLDTVDSVARQHRRRIQTAELNRFFAEVIEEKPPPLHHGHAVRLYYITQATTRPPTFVLSANKAEGLAPSYKRFIMNRLRDRYGFRGTPLRIALKQKKDRHKADDAD
ncbi:MAG: ribosome biogenesis GTPase Der [Deltaproteobacteria bacterium]|nr:ribosome biogenesis GTPase Der [Deltaproteobacteria bacterium]